jgi:hypothetical protein
VSDWVATTHNTGSMFRNNNEWRSKPLPKLKTKWYPNRLKEFAEIHWHDIKDWELIGQEQKLLPVAMLCIARADSHLWYALKSKHNYWNVGNNDRWDTIAFKTRIDWIRAIWTMALNGRYLRHKQSIWSLSPWWWGNPPYYATSESTWNVNVLNCISHIRQTPINENFIFRIK